MKGNLEREREAHGERLEQEEEEETGEEEENAWGEALRLFFSLSSYEIHLETAACHGSGSGFDSHGESTGHLYLSERERERERESTKEHERERDGGGRERVRKRESTRERAVEETKSSSLEAGESVFQNKKERLGGEGEREGRREGGMRGETVLVSHLASSLIQNRSFCS